MNPIEKLENPYGPKAFLLGFQHLFAMFGATVLVPVLTGLNPAVALVCAGLGTLLFHLITKGKVPVFVGSSFAYIAAFQAIIKPDPNKPANVEAIRQVQGAVIIAGAVYLLIALIVRLVGIDRIKKIFPPVVTGPVIVVIGLTLSPTAINMASSNWIVAIITLAVVIIISVFAKGFFKLVPILFGIGAGYLVSVIFTFVSKNVAAGSALHTMLSANTADGIVPLINFQPIADASWISPFWDFTSGKFFTLPAFELSAILLIAPIALVTFMEHIGDITTNGTVVGKDFIKDPGLHRTLIGDGAATMLAGFFGGPANTTYSENTGVLAVTKVYDPHVIRLAAVFAVVLGLFGKFAAVLQTIPSAVMGGVSILLFGMIATVGLRSLADAKLDFTKSRNLIIIALILVVGIGLSSGITVTLGGMTFVISGLFLAVLIGAIANAVLPEDI